MTHWLQRGWQTHQSIFLSLTSKVIFFPSIRQESVEDRTFLLKGLCSLPAPSSQWKQRLLAVELQLNLSNKEELP